MKRVFLDECAQLFARPEPDCNQLLKTGPDASPRKTMVISQLTQDLPSGTPLTPAPVSSLTDEVATDERVIDGEVMIVIKPEVWYQFCQAVDRLVETVEVGQLALPLSPE